MQILIINGYKFINLFNLEILQKDFIAHCSSLNLKGTILLSDEGINITLAGNENNIHAFINFLQQNEKLKDICFRKSCSATPPFKRLKIKLKKEIITFRKAEINVTQSRAKQISPEMLKRWLDEHRDITLLDTRNHFEIEFGTFTNAVNLHIDHFTDFPAAVHQQDQLDRTKTIVTFCTGGIRCEKAAVYLQNEGFSAVYQLEGGILNYFDKIGSAHYQGKCFVFDERVAVSANE